MYASNDIIQRTILSTIIVLYRDGLIQMIGYVMRSRDAATREMYMEQNEIHRRRHLPDILDSISVSA